MHRTVPLRYCTTTVTGYRIGKLISFPKDPRILQMTSSRRNKKLIFPTKLYQIIEVENPEIIRWEEDGKSFRIADYDRFENDVLPKFFRRKYRIEYKYLISTFNYEFHF